MIGPFSIDRRYPFDWNTLSGYLVAWLIQCARNSLGPVFIFSAIQIMAKDSTQYAAEFNFMATAITNKNRADTNEALV